MPLNQTLADTLQFDGWEGAHDLLDEATVDTPTISGYDKHFNKAQFRFRIDIAGIVMR